jgi:hypothetical protein
MMITYGDTEVQPMLGGSFPRQEVSREEAQRGVCGMTRHNGTSKGATHEDDCRRHNKTASPPSIVGRSWRIRSMAKRPVDDE